MAAPRSPRRHERRGATEPLSPVIAEAMRGTARLIAIDLEHVGPRRELGLGDLAFSDLHQSAADFNDASRLRLTHSEPIA